MSKPLDDLLVALGACGPAREWAQTQPDLKSAWEACTQPGWLHWLAAGTAVSVAREANSIAVSVAHAVMARVYAAEVAHYVNGTTTMNSMYAAYDLTYCRVFRESFPFELISKAYPGV